MTWQTAAIIILGLAAWQLWRDSQGQEAIHINYNPVFDTPSGPAIQTGVLYPGVSFPAAPSAVPDMLQIMRGGQ